jgi:hypothetical protein
MRSPVSIHTAFGMFPFYSRRMTPHIHQH